MRALFVKPIERSYPVQFEGGLASIGYRHNKLSLAESMRELDKPQHVDPAIAALHHQVGVVQMAVERVLDQGIVKAHAVVGDKAGGRDSLNFPHKLAGGLIRRYWPA